MKTYIIGATLIGALSACSGGDDPVLDAAAYTALEAQFGAIDTAMMGESPISPSGFETAGTASYSGVYFMDHDSDSSHDILGDAQVSVDFSDDTMSTTVADLYMRGGLQLNGTLSGNGSFSRSGAPDISFPTFGGTLTGAGDSYEISGSLDGQFYGTSAEYISVSGSGTVSTNGGAAESVTGYMLATLP